MQFDEVFDQICRQAPLPVMARGLLTKVFNEDSVDAVFREHATRQYEGELPFSAVVRLMMVVSCKIRPSVNSAFQRDREKIGVSIASVYNKLKGVEPSVTRAIVRETALAMLQVNQKLNAPQAGRIEGYAIRILDGHHLEASHHRIKETRESASAPLPGVGLAVLDPVSRLVLDYIPCEDAHAQERSLLPDLIDDLESQQLWIADRNFCTSAFLWEIHTSRSCFVIRKHAANVKVEPIEAEKPKGSCETGELFEQPVHVLDDFGNQFQARRIRVRLKSKTRDGETELILLSNLPGGISCEQIAAAYRDRWSIESAFGEIRRCLHGEINALGYPKAALFSFAMALVSFNVLSIISNAIGAARGEDAQESFSTQQAAEEINVMWSMTTIIDSDTWKQRYAKMNSQQIASELKRLAGLVELQRYKKHNSKRRSPPRKRKSAPKNPHVATARLLEERK